MENCLHLLGGQLYGDRVVRSAVRIAVLGRQDHAVVDAGSQDRQAASSKGGPAPEISRVCHASSETDVSHIKWSQAC